MTGERTRSERLLHETVGASVLSRHLGHRQLHTHIFAYANTCVNSPHLAAVLSRGGRCRCGTRRLLRPARRPTVILATDGLAITLAEHWVGAGKGVANMMGMVISTGVGGALILSGRPMYGASGNAGHIGHIEVSAMDGESTFGQAISSAAALLDLELVVIGGGFSQATPDLFRIIRETVASHHFEFVRKVRVVPSSLSGAGPLVGAAALVHLTQ